MSRRFDYGIFGSFCETIQFFGDSFIRPGVTVLNVTDFRGVVLGDRSSSVSGPEIDVFHRAATDSRLSSSWIPRHKAPTDLVLFLNRRKEEFLSNLFLCSIFTRRVLPARANRIENMTPRTITTCELFS